MDAMKPMRTNLARKSRAYDEDGRCAPRSLPGGIYCSPRCGGRCTRREFDRATAEAAALAKRMGEGWEPRVWENLGWHYEVHKGAAVIHVTIDRNAKGSPVVGYWADIQTAKQFIADAKEPEDALGFAIQDARSAERKIANDLLTII